MPAWHGARRLRRSNPPRDLQGGNSRSVSDYAFSARPADRPPDLERRFPCLLHRSPLLHSDVVYHIRPARKRPRHRFSPTGTDGIAECRTGWQDWSRYSGRQRQRVEMGGLVGRVTYEGDLSDYLPLLVLGELVHVGKGTVFGNGQYRIVKEKPNVAS